MINKIFVMVMLLSVPYLLQDLYELGATNWMTYAHVFVCVIAGYAMKEWMQGDYK